jgi:osmotically-inducible protein OsmY
MRKRNIIIHFLYFLVILVMIVTFSACKSTRALESTSAYIDDSVITAEAKDAIFEEPSLKVFQIAVETYQGNVKITGSVDSQKAVDKVDEMVRSIKGVKSLKNNLIVI